MGSESDHGPRVCDDHLRDLYSLGELLSSYLQRHDLQKHSCSRSSVYTD